MDPPAPENKPASWITRHDPWNVDHIIPVKQGGTDDPDNLRLLCISCHNAVGYEQRDAQGVLVDADIRV